jgi:hypothetical protein
MVVEVLRRALEGTAAWASRNGGLAKNSTVGSESADRKYLAGDLVILKHRAFKPAD